ncbi:MAG: hypothetical protein A2X23_12245, partial [Chloroflexi bacterium GWC2_73_18]
MALAWDPPTELHSPSVRYRGDPMAAPQPLSQRRPIRTAEIVAVGSELTVGETRNTNAGELARDLSDRGVTVTRLVALPDRLDELVGALREALGRADLVTTTGGLGPTPDDLTREAIAALLGEEPAIDPALEAELRGLFARRGIEMPETNRKQAWLVPSATPLPNPNGTAPGWWVDVPGPVSPDGAAGRVIVALPGPPREMRPIWRDQVIPRLEARGLGLRRVTRTLRLTGIGESLVAARLGPELLGAPNPEVATYARHDAVDVRISAVDGPGGAAAELVAAAEARVLKAFGEHVFARGDETWVAALGRRLAGRRVALVEIGTAGALTALLGSASWLVHAELLGRGAAGGDLRRLATDARLAHD